MKAYLITMIILTLVRSVCRFVTAGETDDGKDFIAGLVNLGLFIWGLTLWL